MAPQMRSAHLAVRSALALEYLRRVLPMNGVGTSRSVRRFLGSRRVATWQHVVRWQ